MTASGAGIRKHACHFREKQKRVRTHCTRRGYDEKAAIRIHEGSLRKQETVLPVPLHPRYQRPDSPLAEVQVAEEEGLLELGTAGRSYTKNGPDPSRSQTRRFSVR